MGRGVVNFNLAERSVRELNQYLHDLPATTAAPAPGSVSASPESQRPQIRVEHPEGRHNLAVGLDAAVDVEICGHAGYFIAGMNKQAHVTVQGNVGWSVAENMMSGEVRVNGEASECAGASAHGGLLVIKGDASSRCGISLKGGTIVVGGSVGHMSAFMAQAGTLVVCGDAGPALGDSLYEAVIYVGGKIASLGADAQEEPLTDQDVAKLTLLLKAAGIDRDPRSFKRIGSARKLYHWHADAGQTY